MTESKRMTAAEQAALFEEFEKSDAPRWPFVVESFCAALSAERAHSAKVEALLLSYYRGGNPREAAREVLRTGVAHVWNQDQDETNCIRCDKQYSVDVDLAGCTARTLREAADAEP